MNEMTPEYLHQQLEIDLAEIRAKKAAYDDVTFYAKTVQVFREYFLRMLPAWQADRKRLEEIHCITEAPENRGAMTARQMVALMEKMRFVAKGE